MAKYDLSGNPFSEERHDFPMVGRVDEWQRIMGIVVDLVHADSCGIMVIHGNYGMGKTFTLLKIREEIQQGSIKDPIGEVLPVFLKAMESQTPSNYMSNLLTRSLRELGRKEVESIAKKAIQSKAKVDDETLLNVFTHLANGNDEAWNWLIGRSMSSSQNKELGASYKITDPRESQTTFREFLKILRRAGFRNLVIILDEWEYLLVMTSGNKLRSVIHDLQLIWDSYNETSPSERKLLCKVVFVIGCSPDSWQRFIEMAKSDLGKKGGGGTETFLRRIPERAKISLSPLKDKDVRRLLINRLKGYREDKGSDDRLYPFDESYVQFISEVSMGIPSHVINLSSLILDEAANRNIEKINRRIGEEVLHEFGILKEMQSAGSSR